jgi:flagellar biosynthesis/type III secretory pathway protein FliH
VKNVRQIIEDALTDMISQEKIDRIVAAVARRVDEATGHARADGYAQGYDVGWSEGFSAGQGSLTK